MDRTTRLITQSDQQREEADSHSVLRRTLSWFRGRKLFVSLVLLFFLIIFFTADMLIIGPKMSAVTMSLNYEQASAGLTPNSTRFNMYEIKTEPVLQKLLEYSGLEGTVSTDTLAECISVEATHDKSSDDTSDFISTSYRIEFINTGIIRERSAETMLSLLCKAYREYFYENYAVSLTSAGQNLDLSDSSTEYLTQVDIFASRLAQIERYAGERAAASGNFKDVQSGLSFSDIQMRADNLISYDLVNLRSYVILNAISSDAENLRNQLLFRKRMEKLDYDKYIAAYSVNNEGILLYDEVMTDITMIPTMNENSQFYMSVATTGMDDMVRAADEELNLAIGKYKEMESDQTIADAVGAKPVNNEQWQKAEDLTNDMEEKIDELFSDLAITDKAYESSHVQRYMMFSDPVSAHEKRSALIEAALLTAVVAIFWFMIVYLGMSKKEKSGEKK